MSIEVVEKLKDLIWLRVRRASSASEAEELGELYGIIVNADILCYKVYQDILDYKSQKCKGIEEMKFSVKSTRVKGKEYHYVVIHCPNGQVHHFPMTDKETAINVVRGLRKLREIVRKIIDLGEEIERMYQD